MARLGSAWLGLAWLGLAWLGLAWLGLARLGSARLGSARLDSALFDSARPACETGETRVTEPSGGSPGRDPIRQPAVTAGRATRRGASLLSPASISRRESPQVNR